MPTRRERFRESVNAHPHLTQFLGIVAALITGFASTQTNTGERLKAIEQQNSAVIRTLTAIERRDLDQSREIFAHDQRLVALEHTDTPDRSTTP